MTTQTDEDKKKKKKQQSSSVDVADTAVDIFIIDDLIDLATDIVQGILD